jgi:hypothetical protein
MRRVQPWFTGETMSRWKLRIPAVLLAAAATLTAASLHAAPPNKKKIMTDEPEAAPSDAAMPTISGKGGKITDAINGDTGAIWDLGGGVTMTFPKGLPVGRSRLVTLAKGRALPGSVIDAKWKPLGPTLDFSGAFNTSGKPIVLAIAEKNDPVKTGMKLVVAMEVGSFCEAKNKAYKLKGGLCSGFELHDAEYDSSERRLLAKLRSTGGLRMQFGLVPE